MLGGDRVLLRPMKQDDVSRQHEFNQDVAVEGAVVITLIATAPSLSTPLHFSSAASFD
jgi:hypothetical protein